MNKKMNVLVALLIVGGVVTAARIINGSHLRRRAATEMADRAKSFLSALTPEQRARAAFNFEDAERLNWHFIPRARAGVSLKDLDIRQRKLAHDFLQSGLSARGYLKTTTIIALESVLRQMENRAIRDPELYYFSVFGTPSAKALWGWRVEGHHISLNFTVAGDRMIAATPSFLGANPAEVRVDGPQRGQRALGAEEDIARQLLGALDEKQRLAATFDAVAPPDILTGNAKAVEPLAQAGILAGELKSSQQEILRKLIGEYASTMAPELAAERLEKLRRAGFEKIRFAWAGGIERGQPHYYRIQGPTFLIEYDNTQNNANHVHTVWRDFNGDFGRDLIREHYQKSPH